MPILPEFKCPLFPGPDVYCSSVQISSIQAPRVQLYRLYEQSLDFPVRPLRKFSNCNVETLQLNCLYNFHRFLSTPILKIQFLALLFKIHHRSLSFIHVNSVLLHLKTKNAPSFLPLVVFSLSLDNKGLELYYCWRKR